MNLCLALFSGAFNGPNMIYRKKVDSCTSELELLNEP